MKLQRYIKLLIFFAVVSTQAQHTITINSILDIESNTLNISQEIQFKNTSNVSLNELYLSDWANSFSSKTTSLAKRFSENYQGSFHFEKNKNRGHSNIVSINNNIKKPLVWSRGDELDIIRIQLDKKLLPGEVYILKMLE